MQLADLISGGELTSGPPKGQGDGKPGSEGAGMRFDELVKRAISAADGMHTDRMQPSAQGESNPSIIAIGIPTDEATDALRDQNSPAIAEEASPAGTGQVADKLSLLAEQVDAQNTAAGVPPFDIKETSRAADALAEEIFAIQREDADPQQTVTGAGLSDEAVDKIQSDTSAGIKLDRSLNNENEAPGGASRAPELVGAEESDGDLMAESRAQSTVRVDSESRSSHIGEPKDLRASSISQGSDQRNSSQPATQTVATESAIPAEKAVEVTSDLRGVIDTVDDAGQHDSDVGVYPPALRSTNEQHSDIPRIKRAPSGPSSPAEPTSATDSKPNKDVRTVPGAQVIDSARAVIDEPEAVPAEAGGILEKPDSHATEQMVLPLDNEGETTIDETGKPVSSTSLTAETSADRSTTSARPVLAPRSIVSAAWLRAMMEQGLHVHSEPEGWNSVTMRLGEEDGTMTVRTRREDGAVAVHVVFSDPNLRAMAAQQIDRLEAVLQKQYDTSIDLSLSDAGANANGQRDDERTSADGGRATLSPQNESTASPRRSLWARNEWVV